MHYFDYILHSITEDKFYIGYSSELTERIIRHNQKSKGFTGSTNDWEFNYYETFDNKNDAINREKQIKNWKSKIKIMELINTSAL
jgi:putative endonuclease